MRDGGAQAAHLGGSGGRGVLVRLRGAPQVLEVHDRAVDRLMSFNSLLERAQICVFESLVQSQTLRDVSALLQPGMLHSRA